MASKISSVQCGESGRQSVPSNYPSWGFGRAKLKRN
jgi:hypothetical protein